MEPVQGVAVELVDRLAPLGPLAHLAVDLARGKAVRDHAARQMRQFPSLCRIIAFVGDGDDGVA